MGKISSMIRLLKIVSYCVVAMAYSGIYAQAVTAPNGCGTGWNRYLVPDRIKLVGCEFKAACDAHDICYGACESGGAQAKESQCEYLRCQSGGNLHGQAICDDAQFRKLRIASVNRRAECDGKFLIKLQEINPEKPHCTLFTALYPFAVRVLGGKAFIGADSLDAQYSEEEKRKYAEALNQLFEKWPQEKLRQFEADFKAGNTKLDMTKPIRFDATRGLINVNKN
jgi:hypothetical protein